MVFLNCRKSFVDFTRQSCIIILGEVALFPFNIDTTPIYVGVNHYTILGKRLMYDGKNRFKQIWYF